ncbi:Hypothetical predicted protein [Olea europaea subsp. europaea]|uniref:Uncharacterized protein n=1 Tax=Olea europaea subsp. europaea TaxID=158383 RepID=A0A8S0S8N1_OLEEU|nr:Hypothetical predicted protein [Olea europaea subsp. europaea]
MMTTRVMKAENLLKIGLQLKFRQSQIPSNLIFPLNTKKTLLQKQPKLLKLKLKSSTRGCSLVVFRALKQMSRRGKYYKGLIPRRPLVHINWVNNSPSNGQLANDDYESYESGKPAKDWSTTEVSSVSDSIQPDLPFEYEKDPSSEATEASQAETKVEYKRMLSGGLQSPKADVPKREILQRINSKKAASSYQLGQQLSLKWSTGAGPRIGCIADYPVELRLQALELTNLSPRTCQESSTPGRIAVISSPTACRQNLVMEI